MTDFPGTLRAVADAIAAGLPVPCSIDLHISTGRAVSLQLKSNQPDQLQAWADHLGYGVRIQDLMHPGSSNRPAWRVHRTAGLLDGAEIEVWGAVDVTRVAS